METLTLVITLAAALSAYVLWFYLVLAKTLTGPKVWPFVGSLPLLFKNRSRVHDWIAGNLRAAGGSATYQTCIIPIPFLAHRQGFYTVTCHPKNIEHILKTRFSNYPKGPKWQTAFHDMNDAVLARKEAPSDDLLSRFMKKLDANGNPIPTPVLQRIALNFVLAGRDTSSVALSWFFWLIMNHPRVEDKIIDEISKVLRDTRGGDHQKWTEEALDFDEADRLVYLKAALAETLRLYPSVPQDFKYAMADDVLPDGTFVPAGSTVTYSIYSVGRMKEIWGDDCMEFKPERWLTVEGDRFEPPKDGFKFVAFNAGPRTCLGKDLAYLQMKSVAAAVLLRYRICQVPGHRVEQKMSLTLFMKNGLHVFLHPRKLQEAA